MNSSYTIIVVDKAATPILHIPIGASDGYAYPLTAAGVEELTAEVERAIAEHEAHLETIHNNEVPM